MPITKRYPHTVRIFNALITAELGAAVTRPEASGLMRRVFDMATYQKVEFTVYMVTDLDDLGDELTPVAMHTVVCRYTPGDSRHTIIERAGRQVGGAPANAVWEYDAALKDGAPRRVFDTLTALLPPEVSIEAVAGLTNAITPTEVPALAICDERDRP